MTSSNLKRRWGVSTAAALLVTFVATICTWQFYRDLLQYPEEMALWSRQNEWTNALKKFRQEHGDYPQALAELQIDERLFDPWGTRPEYERVGDAYRLVSLGADQVAGGVGIDADIDLTVPPDAARDSDELHVPRSQPATFWQFLSRQATTGMLAACGLAGLCTFLAGFLAHRPVGQEAGLAVPAAIVIAGVISVLAATVMALSHLPFEHH